ncbi:unnamed protein product, partial [Mesorhabditis spiculigera]
MSGLREFIRSLVFRPPVRGEAIPEPEAPLEATMDELAETMRNSMKIDLDLEHVESKGAQLQLQSPTLYLQGCDLFNSEVVPVVEEQVIEDQADVTQAPEIQQNQRYLATSYRNRSVSPIPGRAPTPEERLENDIRQRREHGVKDWTASHGTGSSDFDTCLKMFNEIRGDLQLAIASKATSSNQINEELERFDEMCDTLLRAKFEKGIPQAGKLA